MTKQSEREEFVTVMCKEFPAVRLFDLQELMRLARRHGKIAERECNGHQKPNGDWDEAAAARDERASDDCEKRIVALCERIGCKAHFGGDPRGYTVKVLLPSGRYNTMGGAEDGWGVPS